MLANSSAATIGLVDTWAIGHLPDPVLLAAIGVGAFYFNYLFGACGFLRMGTTGMVAQAHGRGDRDAIRLLVLRSLLIGLVIATVIVIARGWLLTLGNSVVQPSPEQQGPIAAYYTVRVWSVPAIFIKLTVLGYLIGTQRMKLALLLEVVLNLGNAALTTLFVMGLGWGIAGAALASLIAEIAVAGAAVAVTAKLLGAGAMLRAIAAPGFMRWQRFRALLSVNAFIFARTLFLLSAFGLLWKLGIAEGGLDASANQILLQFLSLSALGLDGMAYAAEAEVGRALGAGNRALLDRVVRLTTLWAGAIALAYAGIFWLAGDAMVDVFTGHESVRALTRDYLPWLVAMPIVAVWSYQYDGIYIGATAGGAMMVTMALAFATFVGASQILLPRYGNHGLWAAMMLFMAARGILQAAWYPRIRRAASNA